MKHDVYLKPGIWISLVAHLLLFAFLYFYHYGHQLQQDHFVELAEFNLEQPIKQVDMSPIAGAQSARKVTSSSAPKSQEASQASLDKLVSNKQAHEPLPVAEKPKEAINSTSNAQVVNNQSTAVPNDEAGATANDGWRSEKLSKPASSINDQIVSSEQKRVVISAQSSVQTSPDYMVGWGKYGRQISVEASKLKKYPMAALAGRIQGTVMVFVRVSNTGNIAVGVKRTSGHDLLDEQAVAMVSQAVKNIALPAELINTPKDLFIPIQFSL